MQYLVEYNHTLNKDETKNKTKQVQLIKYNDSVLVFVSEQFKSGNPLRKC